MARMFGGALAFAVVLIVTPLLLLWRSEHRSSRSFRGQVVLYSAFSAKIRSLDPATCGDTSSAVMQTQAYESLYHYHYLKRPVEVIPVLAAAMPEVSADNLTYTIPIRTDIRYAPNVCFGRGADGRPKTRSIRASDFVLAFKRVSDFHVNTTMAWSFLSGRIVGLDEFRKKTETYQAGDFSRYDLDIEGIQAINDSTLQFKLTAPYPQFLYVLAMHSCAPIPPEVIDYYLATEASGSGRKPIPIEQRSTEITLPEQVVGTGAYILTEFDPAGRIIFERNPEYHHGFYPTEGSPGDREAGLLADAGKPLPFIDVLYYEFVGEDSTAWMRFLAHQVDVGGIPRDVFASVITADRALEEAYAKEGIRLIKSTDPTIFFLAFNMQDPVVGASRALRQAMALGFDVEQYIDVLWNGRGKRAMNIVPSAIAGHDEAGPGPYARYDPAEAKRLIAQATQELGALGRLDSRGRIPGITVELGGTDEQSRRYGAFLQQQFSAIGLEIKISPNDWPTQLDKIHNKMAQTYSSGWHADYPDAENFLQLFYGPNIKKGTNNTNYSNAEFDALYDRVKVMGDSPERRELYGKMARIISEDLPVLVIFEPETFTLTYDWVKNIKPHPFSYGMTKYRRIDEDRRRRMGGREPE